MRERMRIRLSLAVLSLAGGTGLATVSAPAASAAACTDIDVVSARGTFEPGNLGTIVGDPVYSALQRKLTGKSLSSYKVNYPRTSPSPRPRGATRIW